MFIEVINTGSELLLGQVLNTHLRYFSESLMRLGLRVSRQVTIPDGEVIACALKESLERADVILITGGLGPTTDDMTREIVASYFKRKLEFSPEIEQDLLAFFAQRNRTCPENNKVQAMVPEGATVLHNAHGTAPGLYLEENGKHVFCLPGPPRELYPICENTVWPILQGLQPQTKSMRMKTLRMSDLGESSLQEIVDEKLHGLQGLEVGYCARAGLVDLRLISKDEALLSQRIDETKEVLQAYIYGEDADTLESVVVHTAKQNKKQIATAESCTGGQVATRLTNIPGASQVFNRGWVTYSNEAKVAELNVPPELIETHGAVSKEVAEAMARGAVENANADLAVSLTGIAGPTGDSSEKPVGLVFIGMARKTDRGEIFTETLEKRLVPDRETFKLLASNHALDLLRKTLVAE
ncbi:MAG: competence/damage-inducible protein A [Verrucomicrobiota bacterium]